MKKSRNISVFIGIIALTMVSRLDSIIAPSIVKIQQFFPNADPTQVESIASIGDVASMIASFIFGFILTRMTYKWAATFGVALIAAGGLLPIFVHKDVAELIVFALIVGLGSGIVTTVLPSLTAAEYSDERRSSQFGINVALEDGFAMVWILISGYLANVSWIHNYYIYVVALAALVLVIIFVPNDKATDSNSSDTNSQAKTHWPLIIGLIIIAMLAEILVAVMTNKMAIYLHAYHIGTPSTASQALIFVRIASIVAGVFISMYRKVFGNYLMVAGFVSVILGALLFINIHTFWSSALGAFLIGTGASTNMITIPFLLSNITASKVYPIVMGSFSALTSLGFAFSAYIFRFTAPIFSSNNLIGTFEAMIALSVLITVILLVTKLQKRSNLTNA